MMKTIKEKPNLEEGVDIELPVKGWFFSHVGNIEHCIKLLTDFSKKLKILLLGIILRGVGDTRDVS